MATLNLPTFPATENHRYNVVLDGNTIEIEWRYNARADRWTCAFFDASGAAIRHGVRLVLIDDLLKRVALASKPLGTFPVVDTTGADLEPDAATLGAEVRVRYVEA